MFIEIGASTGIAPRIVKEIDVHAISTFRACIWGYAHVRDRGSRRGAQRPSAREQLQHIHTPQSIDQELARLTKDLELTPEQQKQVRPLLEGHHAWTPRNRPPVPTAYEGGIGATWF